MSNPDISVIIPIYGTEKYLDKCICSVRQQTFQNIEIICVDDCSPDNSYKIVEKHIKQDKRVKLIRHEKNLGLGGARNTAISESLGEYIASVDSDDVMLSNMLEVLWENTNKKKVDIVCCGFNCVNERDEILSHVEYVEKQVKNHKNNIDIFSLLNPAFWNKLWRRSLYINNGIYFPTHDYYEDMSTTPRILAKAKSIKVIKDRLYNYLIRPESITGSYGSKHILDYIKGFETLFDFLERENLYSHYEKEFNAYIEKNIIFHSKSILSSDLYVEDKKQYLRNLLLLRVSFQENYQSIKNKDLDDLIIMQRFNFSGTYKLKYERSEKNLFQKDNQLKETSDNLNDHRKKLTIAIEEKNKLKNKTKELLGETNRLGDESKGLMKEMESLNKKNDRLKYNYQQLQKHASVSESKVFELESIMADTLAPIQSFWVLIFGFIARPTMSRQQYLKLKRTPNAFFRDSKSKSAKIFALLAKIIDS